MSQEQLSAKDKIKKVLANSKKCAYPGCKSNTMMNVMLPIGQMLESGMIEFPQEGKNSSVQSSVPLCDYHFVFAQKSLLSLVDQGGMIRLVGPFPIIDVVEGVLEAVNFHKTMKTENAKNTKKAK